MYFREYFCSFSSKLYYFYILGVSYLKGDIESKKHIYNKAYHTYAIGNVTQKTNMTASTLLAWQ